MLCSATWRRKKKDKSKPAKEAKKDKGTKASPCKAVIGKLHYNVTKAKDPESKASAQDRLEKYKSMSNEHKGEFAALYDVNNGSVTWQAEYLDQHASFSREALKFEEGWMTRTCVRP